MIPIKTSVNFSIQELVHPEIYDERGDLAWHLLDERIVQVADVIRNRYGPTYCNTWAFGSSVIDAYGYRDMSGLRPASLASSIYSQHCYGRALDLIFQDVSAYQVRQDIIHNNGINFSYPVVLECMLDGEEISWLHIAVGNYQRGQEYNGNPSMIVV